MNRKELTYKVKESVKLVDPNARIILFGSRARRDNKGSSDWDFLILTSYKADEPIKRQIRNGLIDTELEAQEVMLVIVV